MILVKGVICWCARHQSLSKPPPFKSLSAAIIRRNLCATQTLNMEKKALLLGVYAKDEDNGSYKFTRAAQEFDSKCEGKLKKLIDIVGPLKKCKTRTFWELSSSYDLVSVVGLGPATAGFNEVEELHEDRENIRAAVASGIRCIRDVVSASVTIDVDDCNDPEASAEGCHLSTYYFDELKSEAYKKKPATIKLLSGGLDDGAVQKWNTGTALAEGQNIARRLTELPANLLTPTKFAEIAQQLGKEYKFDVIAHNKEWAQSQKMGCFLSVTQGSDQPPVFLEIRYNNLPNTKPLVFVGKGICFDTGGYSLKPPSNMDKMRGDMGGAANVLATVATLARLKAKVNIVGLTPLCENAINGKATKPGDVATAMNGKTVQIDNTDAEGRLILADALCYAHTFDPELIMDIATLTGAMRIALGSSATGVFSTNQKYWELLRKSGMKTGDRVWRLPLFNHFTKQVTDSQLADLNNIGKHSPAGGSCIAAVFLKEFVTCANWMHLDIAGVMENKDEVPYLCKGMSGRPLRTLVDFIQSVFN